MRRQDGRRLLWLQAAVVVAGTCCGYLVQCQCCGYLVQCQCCGGWLADNSLVMASVILRDFDSIEAVGQLVIASLISIDVFDSLRQDTLIGSQE